MIRFACTLAVALGLAGPAVAQSFDTLQKAQALGSVLAAEEVCGLSYDQAAIEAWIAANIPADDMQFAGQLAMMTKGGEFELQDMGASARTAHCTQIRRVAGSYGFTK